MNLTQTKRWKEFEDWYDNQNFLYSIRSGSDNIPDFDELDFEFQEGVYRKFIQSQVDKDQLCNYSIEISPIVPTIIIYTLNAGWDFSKKFDTFQELVEWFFTNE